MSNEIHLTVATICVNQGKVLMVEEFQGGELVINQPAGHVEPGEALKDAAIRETLEETGYSVQLEWVLGISLLRTEKSGTYYRVSFLASCEEQTPNTNLDPDIERAIWMTPDQILQQSNHRSDLVCSDIKRYLSGERYPLEIIAEKS